MTREEAIKIVRGAIKKPNTKDGYLGQALDMAIKALKQEPKTGCEGCIYEKTGNSSTYPCSHCGRCYTDKYKAKREGEE